MKNTFTVISFGNYETKILVCNYLNKQLYPLYKTSFLTGNCIDNSIVRDPELLIDIVNKQIARMPIDIKETQLIFNVPVKSIGIKTYNSDEIIINNILTSKLWNQITKNIKTFAPFDNKREFTRKYYSWNVDGKLFEKAPIDKEVGKFSFKLKSYFIDSLLIKSYLEVFEKLNIQHSYAFLCDSIVIHKMFVNEPRRNKLLLNIGHMETSLEYFNNSILTEQKSIPFGIKNLTSKICELASIPEVTAIDLLKIYRDLSNVDTDLPLVNHFKEKFSDYTQTLIADVDVKIKQWLDELVNHINRHIDYLHGCNYDVDEIYIYSSTNIFNTWLDRIKRKLVKFVDIICLESKMIGVSESKFISLMASMLYFIDQN